MEVLAIRSVKVQTVLNVLWQVSEVHCQVGSILLLLIIDQFICFFASMDQDDIIPLDHTTVILLFWLILEPLFIYEIIEQPVGGCSLETHLSIIVSGIFQLLQVFRSIRSHTICATKVLLLTNDALLVHHLKSLPVRLKAFNKLHALVFLVFIRWPTALDNVPKDQSEEHKDRS